MSLAAMALALVAPAGAGTVRGRVEVVGKRGERVSDVAGTVVWVSGPAVRPAPATASMVMKGKAFVPRVVVVPVGGSVEFPNQDPVFHNVFSLSGSNRFDLDLYKRPKSGVRVFEHSGLVRVYCNIHPQMSGFVLVVDGPFWARGTEDGQFVIPDVPAGKWTVKAWHERAGEPLQQAVTVPERGEVELWLTLDASRFKAQPHKNKFGKDYRAGEGY